MVYAMSRLSGKIIIIFVLAACHLSLSVAACAEVLDRIVAIVNNQIILQSEFNDSLKAAEESDPGVSGKKVLNDMIDRILLLEDAKKLQLGSSANSGARRDDDAVVKEYIERRIRAFIHIPIEEIESYYNNNRQEFGDNEFYEVKDKIEGLLVETALKRKLAEHIQELRKKAYIRIQLENRLNAQE